MGVCCPDLAGDAAMMGVQATSARLFYDFCLDDHIPSNHILRRQAWPRPVNRRPKKKAAKTKKESHKEHEKLLDRELEESFPASDPPSLTQPTTEMGGPDRRHKAKY
jgi:hypothetical protein